MLDDLRLCWMTYLHFKHVCVYIYCIYIYTYLNIISNHINHISLFPHVALRGSPHVSYTRSPMSPMFGAALPGSRSAPRPSKSAFNLASAACDTERSSAKSAECLLSLLRIGKMSSKALRIFKDIQSFKASLPSHWSNCCQFFPKWDTTSSNCM